MDSNEQKIEISHLIGILSICASVFLCTFFFFILLSVLQLSLLPTPLGRVLFSLIDLILNLVLQATEETIQPSLTCTSKFLWKVM